MRTWHKTIVSLRGDGTTGGGGPGGNLGGDGRGRGGEASGGRHDHGGCAGSTGSSRGGSTTAGNTSSAGSRGGGSVQAVGGRTGLDGNGGRVDNVSLRVGQSDGNRGTGSERDGPDVRSVLGTIGEGLESGGRSLTTGNDGQDVRGLSTLPVEVGGFYDASAIELVETRGKLSSDLRHWIKAACEFELGVEYGARAIKKS